MKYELKVGQSYEIITWRKFTVEITAIEVDGSNRANSVIFYREKGLFNFIRNCSGEDFVKKIARPAQSVTIEI